MPTPTTAAYYPDFETFRQLADGARPGARLSPAGQRLAHAGQRVPQDRRRPLRLPVRERGRRREGRPLQLPGHRAVLRDRGLRQPGDDQRLLGRLGRRHAHAGHPAVRVRQPAWRSCGGGSRRSGRSTCRNCRRSAAGRSATPATTRSATSSTCPTPRPTTARCPTWPSPSTTRWSSSTTSTKTIVVVAMARLDKPGVTPRDGLRRRLPAGRRPGRAACRAALRRCSRSTSARTARSTLAVPVELHAGRVRGGGARSASSTSAPATSSRSSSASGWRCRLHGAPVRDLPHAAGGQPQPVHVLRAHARA